MPLIVGGGIERLTANVTGYIDKLRYGVFMGYLNQKSVKGKLGRGWLTLILAG